MRPIAAATVVAASLVALALPALAAQTHRTAKQQVVVPTPGTVGYVNGRPYSIYEHRPEYDVYVNGQYVGSDPDPRVRYHLREEWCADTWDGC
ncbi:MAG TPA: hypothetical protein VFA53_12590 [Xanthobacteraceae bacterium]|nr:hypothetical protein [Xanthobacteraceae bacterium]